MQDTISKHFHQWLQNRLEKLRLKVHALENQLWHTTLYIYTNRIFNNGLPFQGFNIFPNKILISKRIYSLFNFQMQAQLLWT